VCCSVLQCGAVCCSVLQCVAVCCSVLQCVAMCSDASDRFMRVILSITLYASHVDDASLQRHVVHDSVYVMDKISLYAHTESWMT